MTDTFLPAEERIRILTGRLRNLRNGSGDFKPEGRAIAIAAAEAST
jgi:hypothetical protein